jgi:hypothetical protein
MTGHHPSRLLVRAAGDAEVGRRRHRGELVLLLPEALRLSPVAPHVRRARAQPPVHT